MRYLRIISEEDRRYRTHVLIRDNSRQTIKRTMEQGRGIFGLSREELSKNRRKGAGKIVKERLGIHSLTKDEIRRNARKGGESNAKNKTGFCGLSTAQKRKIGLKAVEQGTGIHGLTDDEKLDIAKKGGRKAVELGRGIHAISRAQRRAMGLGAYEKGTGIHAMTFEQRSKLGKRNARMLAERNMTVRYRGNNYPSASEAAIASLFEKYIPGWRVKKGTTWQIDTGIGIIDFLVNRSFVEYHPPKPFYGKSRRGDFRNHGEYVKYASIKTRRRIRTKRGEERAREFQRRVTALIGKKYKALRKQAVENSRYKGTELICCSSPEDIYDEIISNYPNNQTKQGFLLEFRRLRKKIIKDNKDRRVA